MFKVKERLFTEHRSTPAGLEATLRVRRVAAATATAATASVAVVSSMVPSMVPSMMPSMVAAHSRAKDGARDKLANAAGGPVCFRRLHEHGGWRWVVSAWLHAGLHAHAHAHRLLGDRLRDGPLGHWLTHWHRRDRSVALPSLANHTAADAKENQEYDAGSAAALPSSERGGRRHPAIALEECVPAKVVLPTKSGAQGARRRPLVSAKAGRAARARRERVVPDVLRRTL